MKWTDTQRIAEELYDLPEFDDDPQRCGERILEAVQQAWIEEAE